MLLSKVLSNSSMVERPKGAKIIEIRAGNSQRPALELRPGEPIQPMSIGRVGIWSLDAPGVLDVHAYVYFDGQALFLQSADANNPAKGNGEPIGGSWQQLELPCTIEMGHGQLVYRALDEEITEERTLSQPVKIPEPPPQFRPGAGAFSNRKQQPDEEATRLAPMSRNSDSTLVNPIDAIAGGAKPAGVPGPAVPMIMQPAPNSATTVAPMPAPPPPHQVGYQIFGGAQIAAPPPQPPQPPMPLGSVMQGGPMQPGMAMMTGAPNMPPGNSGPVPMMISGPYPQQKLPPGAGPSAETVRLRPPSELTIAEKAKAEWNNVKAQWNAMPPLRKVIVGTFPGVALLAYFMLFDDKPPPPPLRPPPAASASATSVSTGTAATATNIPIVVTPTVAPPPSLSAPLPKGKRTQEREAIDLATAGQYQKAAEIYDQLAAQHPEQPAYHEAARLLRARTNPP